MLTKVSNSFVITSYFLEYFDEYGINIGLYDFWTTFEFQQIVEIEEKNIAE